MFLIQSIISLSFSKPKLSKTLSELVRSNKTIFYKKKKHDFQIKTKKHEYRKEGK